MSQEVLYRKWRPQRFGDVHGQDPVITTLRNAVAAGQPAHAYLLSGPRGTGKTTTVARILALLLTHDPRCEIVLAAPTGKAAARLGESVREQAAMLDGASARQVFGHVTLPLARNVVLSGAVMTWARAMGEFGATIIFAGNLPGRTQTMPLAIYLGFELEMGVALALSVLLLALAFSVLFVVKRVLHGQLASVRG